MPPRQQSLIDDLISIAAKFPWWVGIALATVAYFVLHYIATMDIALSPSAREISVSVTKSMFRAFALVLQYVLPIAFLLGALVSFLSRAKRESRHSSASQVAVTRSKVDPTLTLPASGEDLYELWKSTGFPVTPDPDRWRFELLRTIDWKRFEEVCAEYFRFRGFHAVTQSHGPDGGIDVKLYTARELTRLESVVQCKQWNRVVGPKTLRELLGVMTANKVSRGVFVTSSTFNDEASCFAVENRIDLIDGKCLLQKILELPAVQQERLLKVATEGDYLTPTCPSCGIKLVKRESRKDSSTFWGCINFPQCRFTLNA